MCICLYVSFALKNLIFSYIIYIFALSYNISRKWYISDVVLRYHFSPIRLAKSPNLFCWQGQRKASNLICCWWGYKMEQLSQRGIWQYVAKLQQHLLFDLAILLRRIYSDNIITNRRQRCTRSFKVLFITAKTIDSANAHH